MSESSPQTDTRSISGDVVRGAEAISPGLDLAQRLPASFGRYRLERLLGQGGMAVVFLAFDTQLERRVALKIPNFSGRDGNVFRERFLREARSAAKLSVLTNPHLCPVYDVGAIDGVPFLTMAFIDGNTL